MKDIAKKADIKNSLYICDTLYCENNTFLCLEKNRLFEISLIVSGNGIHRVLDKDIPCHVGDVFIIPRDVPHGYFIENKDEEFKIRRLYFNLGDLFNQDVSSPSSINYCFGAFHENMTLGYAALDGHTTDKLIEIWDLIERELSAKSEHWTEAVCSMLSYLLITVARYINSSVKNLSFASCDEWNTVTSAIKIAREEYSNPNLTQENVAGRLYVSKSHFSRIFKKLTGRFFSEYLREIRIKNVCKLLEKSDGNIEDIAKECGFMNIPSFYKNFNAQKNMTPKEYRQSVVFSDSRSEEYIKLIKGEKIMSIINDISVNLQNGKAKIVKELVQEAIDSGVKPEDILNDGLLEGMGVIGEKFKNNEVYVPEVLVAARAMNMGSEVLKPYLSKAGVKASGKVCVGTVQGDLHDIGKNLVKMMMESKGLEVIDLGTDVSAEKFVETAINENCNVICCSALLTTTMTVMADVVKAAEKAGIRDKVKIMIGGAPLSKEYCDKIGADAYTVDATSAAEVAAEFCKV